MEKQVKTIKELYPYSLIMDKPFQAVVILINICKSELFECLKKNEDVKRSLGEYAFSDFFKDYLSQQEIEESLLRAALACLDINTLQSDYGYLVKVLCSTLMVSSSNEFIFGTLLCETLLKIYGDEFPVSSARMISFGNMKGIKRTVPVEEHCVTFRFEEKDSIGAILIPISHLLVGDYAKIGEIVSNSDVRSVKNVLRSDKFNKMLQLMKNKNKKTEVRQYIILRKDCKTKSGDPVSPQKLAAMTAHASGAYINSLIMKSLSSEAVNGEYSAEVKLPADIVEKWFDGSFAKVLLQAKNLNDLKKAVDKCEKAGLKENEDYFLIYDACMTELVPDDGSDSCFVAIGFAPMDTKRTCNITKHYSLYH